MFDVNDREHSRSWTRYREAWCFYGVVVNAGLQEMGLSLH